MEQPTLGEGVDPAVLDAVRAPFVDDAIGIVWDELTLDRVRAHVDTGPRHQQPYGLVHGGVHCAIVETLASVGAALVAARDGRVVVGVGNSTEFLRAHREGRLDAVAEPVHTGRTYQLWRVTITRPSDGRTIAQGQVRLQNLDPERVGQPAPGGGGALG